MAIAKSYIVMQSTQRPINQDHKELQKPELKELKIVKNGWGGRIRTHEWRDQNPLPYRLATPQCSESCCIGSKRSTIKNTIFRPIFLVLLLFSLYSPPSFALAIHNAKQSSKNSKPVLAIKPKYTSNKQLPIQAISSCKTGLMFSDSQNLYLNQKPINLFNLSQNDNGNIQINEIFCKKNNFYLSTNQGFFHNYRKIFNKGSTAHTELSKNKIFIGSINGVYWSSNNEKDFFFKHNWQLMANSPQQVKYFTLNKSKSNIEFLASENGFYYFNPHRKQWRNRSHGLDRDFQDSFALGRFLVLHSKQNSIIYLPSSSGLFISKDKGLTWTKHNQGLQSNPEGFYDLRDIKLIKDKLILITSNGLYISEPENIFWQSITPPNAHKAENLNYDFYSLSISQGKSSKAFAGNSHGEIFELKFTEANNVLQGEVQTIIPSKTLEDDEQGSNIQEQINYDSIDRQVNKLINQEPSIQEVHKAALKFAGIPTGKDFFSYKIQARVRNLLPRFEAFAEKNDDSSITLETNGSDDFSSGSGSISTEFSEMNMRRNDDEINKGLRFAWDLSRLIYDPEVNDLTTTARITANVRENLLTEITQIYFARKELLFEILELQLKKANQINKDFYQKKLELEQYTAQIDARTGGWYSEQINRRTI